MKINKILKLIEGFEDIDYLLESIEQFSNSVRERLGIAQFSLYEKGDDIYLNTIIVGKENQGKGLGSKAMEMLINYADRSGKRLILTPAVQDKIHGTTSRARLVRFYKQFGFKESKGRNIDYEIGAGKMYREPTQ